MIFSLNRTIQELKLVKQRNLSEFKSFKSNHSGIETELV